MAAAADSDGAGDRTVWTTQSHDSPVETDRAVDEVVSARGNGLKWQSRATRERVALL